MPTSFSLRSVLIAIALFACALGAIMLAEGQGLVCFAAVLLAVTIFLAPSNESFASRMLIVLMGVGAGVAGWCALHRLFGDDMIGRYWYRGRLDEMGGWAIGIFIGAWRASHVLRRTQPAE